MKMRSSFAAFAVAMLLLPTSGLFAQASALQEGIKYETIIADYVKATGGEEAHKAIKNIKMTATMAIPAAGLEGKMTMLQDEKHSYTKIELPGIGEEIVGHNGETVWKLSDMTGPEIIDDVRRDMMLRSSKLNAIFDLADDYESIEVSGTEEFNGETCYVVVLKNPDEDPVYNYFSVESKLMVGNKLTNVDPMQGKMEIVSKMSDYKEIAGVMVPYSTVAELAMGISMETTVEAYEVNGEIDKSLFELPEEIKELKEEEGNDK